jgi:hypothetical protein
MGSDRHAAGLVSAEVREQVERAMADPLRVMPRERAMLEKAGFVARRTTSCPRCGGGSYATGLPFPGMTGPGVFDPREGRIWRHCPVCRLDWEIRS